MDFVMHSMYMAKGVFGEFVGSLGIGTYLLKNNC